MVFIAPFTLHPALPVARDYDAPEPVAVVTHALLPAKLLWSFVLCAVVFASVRSLTCSAFETLTLFAVQDPAYFTFQTTYGRAFVMGRSDWEYVSVRLLLQPKGHVPCHTSPPPPPHPLPSHAWPSSRPSPLSPPWWGA